MERTKHMKDFLSSEYIASNLSNARDLSGKTVKECSLLLGIPTSRLKNFEKAKYIPSLPELENLSFLYRFPVSVFFKENGVANFIHSPKGDQIKKLLEIRQQIIATKILIARESAEFSQKFLSKTTSIPTSRIKRYETGISPIPLNELLLILEALDLDPDDFFDHDSPVGDWQNLQSNFSSIRSFPEDIKEFISNPDNLKFLNIAQTISKIGMENLYDFSNVLTKFTQTIDIQD